MEKIINGQVLTTVLSKDQVVSDVQNALWRNAAEAAVGIVKEPLVKVLGRYCSNNNILMMIKYGLDTKEGEAIVSYTLGIVLPFTPQGVKNKKLQRLSEEMRIRGFEILIGEVTDRFISPLVKPLLRFLDTVEVD